MKKKKMLEMLNKIDDVASQYDPNDFDVALCIYIGIGKEEFEECINSKGLKEIQKTIESKSTIFTEDLNDCFSFLLNADEDDDE